LDINKDINKEIEIRTDMFNIFKKKEKRSIDSSGFVSLFEDWLDRTQNKPENIATAYACIRMISNTIAMSRLEHYSVSDKGMDPIYSSSIKTILNNPYMNFTNFYFMESIVSDLITYGNAYAFIDRSPSSIKNLIYIPENQVSVYLITDGDINTDSHYYQVTFKGKSFKVFSEDMLHFKNISNSNRGLVGMNPIEIHRSTFDSANNLNEYMDNFLENGASISGIIESEKNLNAGTIEDLKNNFQSKFAGKRNAGKTPVLPQGLSYKQLKPLSPADADYINTKKMSKYDICEIYGVPPAILGTSDLSYNNTESLFTGFVRFTITPILENIAQEMSLKLIPSYRKNKETIKYVNDSLKLATNKERAESLSLLVNTGIVTPNEAREHYGLSKLDGADNLTQKESSSSNPKDPELIGEGNNPSPADPKTDSNISKEV